MSMELPLTNSDGVTTVAPEDYEWAKNYQWMLNEDGHVVRADAPDFYLCNGVMAQFKYGSFTKHWRLRKPAS
jgi:hypothetical protein